MPESTSAQSSAPILTARESVSRRFAEVVPTYPRLPIEKTDYSTLPPAEAPLAAAIDRTIVRRWITLEYLFDQHLNRPVASLEPTLRAVLLVGAAQILFMDSLPAYAVVDESVRLAKRLVRPDAGRLVNAVLRRISELAGDANGTSVNTIWLPRADALPCDRGVIRLRKPCLPDPRDIEHHLSIATSQPRNLVRRWLDQHGLEQTIDICRHGVLTPPVIAAVEPGFTADRSGPCTIEPHDTPGFVIWRGDRRGLEAFIAGHPARRVQDPTAAKAVEATAHLAPRVIMDYCAGRGTKTRQLALMHPQAKVIALEPSPQRRSDLAASTAALANVSIVDDKASLSHGVKTDLLVLDVPCSNTAVLSRRPEARHRFNRTTLRSLTRLQQQIINASIHLVEHGGRLLYSTCSIESAENHRQVQATLDAHPIKLIEESLTLPMGQGASFQDGGYYALIQKRS